MVAERRLTTKESSIGIWGEGKSMAENRGCKAFSTELRWLKQRGCELLGSRRCHNRRIKKGASGNSVSSMIEKNLRGSGGGEKGENKDH